jgi:hypothetical protein
VPDTNRAHHLRSSTRRGCPASHRVFFTRVAYASPSRGLALRHCLHGSPRLILAVLARAFALPKALRRCVPTEKRSPLPPRPTPAAADRPLAAIFHVGVCRVLVAVYTGALIGRRLSVTVGLAAFLVSGFSSAPHGLRPSAVLMNRRAPHITAHVIFARRPAFSLLPATVCTSHTLRMLRPRSSWRFASACTARHG